MNRLATIAVAILWGIAALFAPGRAQAIEYWLSARPVLKNMPDGTPVTMWGFADEADHDFVTLEGTATVPGPALTVPPGDNTLTVHLANGLPNGAPVSIVIPGQTAVMTPVRVGGRVRSFTAEILPGASATYTFSAVTPGTYLYHSGTNPAVQVQMGLYGAMHKDAAAGQAYPGETYANEVTLLYSEIDPDLHDAVATNDYGPGLGTTSTINYHPQYFLVNGEPFMPGQAPVSVGTPGERTLIRFLNAGLRTHVPVIGGAHLELLAEDGKVYPYPREQYSVDLPALKTIDAVLINPAPGIYPIYDRRLALANANGTTGGLLTHLEVMADPDAPIAVADSATTAEDTPVSFSITANDAPSGPSIDASTVVITGGPYYGSATLLGGVLSYTPAPNYNGIDTLTYTVESLAGALSNEVPVTITILPVNDAPAAANDEYLVPQGQSLEVLAPGVLENDTDVDGDALSALAMSIPGPGGVVAIEASGAFTYTPAPGILPGDYFFSYDVTDGSATSSATLTITVTPPPPNVPPIAVDDTAQTTRNTSIMIAVLANDMDLDGLLVPSSVTIATAPSRGGTAVVNLLTGTITYTPRRNFTGSDVFTYWVTDDDGAVSNTATVRINVVR